MAEGLRDVASCGLQAVTAESVDLQLVDARRVPARRRARRPALAARDEPSLEPFLPTRGDGVVPVGDRHRDLPDVPADPRLCACSGSPQEPTIHPALRESPAAPGARASLFSTRSRTRAGRSREPLGLLETGWRRGGFGDSEEERQLRGKAAASLTRYHARFQAQEPTPMWFERSFTFKLGPHLLRGRVDRCRLAPRGRVRADRLQDRPAQERRRARRGRAAVAVRRGREGGVEPGGVAAGVLLRARR